MFINFDADHTTECDNCGTCGTSVHMSMVRVDRTVRLCVSCFGTLAQAISHASKKLNPRPRTFSKQSGGPREV